jgi:hypothetical protein
MKVSDFSRHALCICAVVIMLAGCGGGSQITPSRSLQQNTTDWATPGTSGPLRGEVLRGHSVVIKTMCPKSQGAHFQANGAASGPHPGKFAAFGAWGWFRQGKYFIWAFHEQFKISSGNSNISGTITGSSLGRFARCYKFLPPPSIERLKYRIKRGGGGVVSTRTIKERTLDQSFY